MQPARSGGEKSGIRFPWAAAVAAAGGTACALWLLPCQSHDPTPQAVEVAVAARPEPAPEPPVLRPEPITPELRRKGYHVCNPHDPIGLGPYRRYVPLTTGRALIPQQGGYTDDHGFDVLIHFHGHRAARIPFVQVSRGTVFVGSDFGLGSHAYSEKLATWRRFPHLLRSLENALKKASGFGDAHIRHLTLSAWSAGYGAVNEILKLHGDERVDAVVLLDGLHASWNPQARHRDGVKAVLMRRIEPIAAFARKARRGEKLFFFTHSQIRTNAYVSTRLTADRLLLDMGLERASRSPGEEPFGRVGAVDVGGFHLWSYGGDEEMAHCSHLRHLATIVRDYIEPAFDTPFMNRDVPPTKAPALGVPDGPDAGAADGGDVDAGVESGVGVEVSDAAIAEPDRVEGDGTGADAGRRTDRDAAIARAGDAGGPT